jgi:predicted dehydrogenase
MIHQRDVERRLRVGVVGVGQHAYRNVLPALTFLPAELVAVADVNLVLAERTSRQFGSVKAYGSASEMYASENLDVVLLCVSPQQHPRLAVEAFAAGLHVWMEKPAAATVADVDMMIAAAGDRITTVGYKKAFMPATLKLVELVESDVLGKVRTVLGVYPMSIPLGDRAYVDSRAPSLWLANGCHPLSLLLSIAGPVADVSVHRGTDDSGVLLLRHRNGVVSNLHLALGAPPSQPFERYIVFGDGKSAEVKNSRQVTFQRGIEFGSEGTSFAPTGVDSGAIRWEPQDSFNTLENKAEFTQGLYGGLAYFFDCVLRGAVPERANLSFARQLAQIHEAAILSDGNSIDLETTDDR